VKKSIIPFILLFLLATLFSLLPGSIPSLSAKDTGVKVVILGDSISAGLGVEPEQAFPFLVQDMLKQKGFAFVKIINGSISGSTTAGATSRLKWYLKIKPDILVLALGANDGLRGLSTDLMTQNLEKSIILAKKNGIKVILAGMIEVLNNVNFSLDMGETNAITGQSGSGKTTLLSLIAGLDIPDSGKILLQGEDLCSMKENRLSRYRATKIGIVFQRFHLMPHLSARENISLPLEILKHQHITDRVDDMLAKIDLQDRQHHLPGQLSGGECQRVAIAAGLVSIFSIARHEAWKIIKTKPVKLLATA
jgi:ABC-type lipoprotein export system ATPase subunit